MLPSPQVPQELHVHVRVRVRVQSHIAAHVAGCEASYDLASLCVRERRERGQRASLWPCSRYKVSMSKAHRLECTGL